MPSLLHQPHRHSERERKKIAEVRSPSTLSLTISTSPAGRPRPRSYTGRPPVDSGQRFSPSFTPSSTLSASPPFLHTGIGNFAVNPNLRRRLSPRRLISSPPRLPVAGFSPGTFFLRPRFLVAAELIWVQLLNNSTTARVCAGAPIAV
jgi:hypothetical protein